MIVHKITRLMGVNANMKDKDKLAYINQIFVTFLQAMEMHPLVASMSGVSQNHSNQAQIFGSNSTPTLNETDVKNAEDCLIIAAEYILEVKIYDWSVLNPVNFMLITMLEHGLQYYPDSVRIYAHLVRIYSKLGMSKCITQLSQNFPYTDDDNFERLGATRFSVYTSFGMNKQARELINDYKDFYRDKINDNKNKIVTNFLQR